MSGVHWISCAKSCPTTTDRRPFVRFRLGCLAEHITAEYLVRIEGRGREPDNHWFDLPSRLCRSSLHSRRGLAWDRREAAGTTPANQTFRATTEQEIDGQRFTKTSVR